MNIKIILKVYLKMLIIGLGIFLTVFCVTQRFAVMILVGDSVLYIHNYGISMKSWSLKCVILASFLFNITILSGNTEGLNGMRTLTSAMRVQCSTSCAIKPTSSCLYMRVDYKPIDDRNRSIVVYNIDVYTPLNCRLKRQSVWSSQFSLMPFML